MLQRTADAASPVRNEAAVLRLRGYNRFVLTEVSIKNFRALKDVTLRLEPLTALVGPNASGKSSLLRAFDPRNPSISDGWRHQVDLEISFHWRGERDQGAVNWVPNRGAGSWSNRSYRFQALRLDPTGLRAPIQVSSQQQLNELGSGLTNIFEARTRSERDDVAKQLCELVPVFRDVDTRVAGGGMKEFKFQDRWHEKVWYGPQEVSDGTMLVLGYLLVPYQQPSPTLLAIEEPERGLHPYLMGQLVQLLRTIACPPSEKRPPIQILLATQSAELLNHLRPEEVRFLSKDPSDGSVKVESVETKDPGWEKAYDAHLRQLGSVWLSGGVGGVPAA